MKTVIEMAREATLLDSRDDWSSVPDEYREAINAFAELVRADERARMAEQPAQPPAWWPAVENILKEYGLQAIDFVADFKAAMADQPAQQEPVGMVKDLFTNAAWGKLDVLGSTKVYLNVAPQPAQQGPCCHAGIAHDCHAGPGCRIAERLKASPPAQRTWVGLTDDEREIASWTDGSFGAGARWADTKLKEKTHEQLQT